MTTLLRAAPLTRTAEPQIRDGMIVLERLSKRFPERRSWMQTLLHPRSTRYTPVVQDVSLQVARGEFFGLLGPNGAGKTTLFKMLSTLILPDGGHATVDGLDVVREASRVRQVLTPVIPEERSLLWRLSARENLLVYAALHGLTGAEKERRVTELLEVVELEQAGDRMVGKFSSGMKQRLLIARALLSRPRVLLLDEPTRSLDPVSARRFRSFLREEIAGRQGCTILLATHNAEEALELCDRVGVLDHGRLLAVGTPERLARTVAEDRYRVWTTCPEHPALDRLAMVTRLSVHGSDVDGWSSVDMEIGGGAEAAAEVLAELARAGVPIARFERIPLSLADLIERIVAHGSGGDAA